MKSSNQYGTVRIERSQYRKRLKLKIYLNVALITSIRHALLIKNRHVTVIAGNSLCIRSAIPCVLGRLKYVVWLDNRNRFNYKNDFGGDMDRSIDYFCFDVPVESD